MKALAFALISVLLATIGSIGTAELLVRSFINMPAPLNWMRSDSRYGYVNHEHTNTSYPFPNTDFIMKVAINSFGLRERELDLHSLRCSDSIRIVAIGDSGTFGFGVNIDERFSNLLEGRLIQSSLPSTVINAGVCGWGTLQETLYALDNLERFNPDVFVLTFCGNDIRNDKSFELGIHDLSKGILPFPGKEFVRKYSHVYRFAAAHMRPILQYQYSRLLGDEDLILDPESATVVSNGDWPKTLARIRTFHARFQQYNPAGLLIVQNTNADNEAIVKQLRRLDNGASLRFLDLSTVRRELAKQQRAVLPYDGHWSREMHQESARALAGLIAELALEGRLVRNGRRDGPCGSQEPEYQ